MKKVILPELALILLLAGMMFLLLYQKEPRADVTTTQVHAAFDTLAEDAGLSSAGNLRIRRTFDLNAEDYELIVYYTSEDSMNVCEFFIIRTDESNLADIQIALEERVSSQLLAFENYGELQTELLNKAVIEKYGNYICLIVADDPQTWLDALKTLLEV